MNYYIQGNKDKADQIKAAFEAKGFECPWKDELGDVQYINVSVNEDGCAYVDPIMGGLHLLNVLKTHPDYKELELPVEPKFKVGDKVIYNGKERTITFMDDHFYGFDGGCSGCRIEEQDKLLSPAPKPHYDISNFKPYQKVLIRFGNNDTWRADFFSHIKEDRGRYFVGIGYANKQCIPFEGNEHLLGTTDIPSEEFINW